MQEAQLTGLRWAGTPWLPGQGTRVLRPRSEGAHCRCDPGGLGGPVGRPAGAGPTCSGAVAPSAGVPGKALSPCPPLPVCCEAGLTPSTRGGLCTAGRASATATPVPPPPRRSVTDSASRGDADAQSRGGGAPSWAAGYLGFPGPVCGPEGSARMQPVQGGRPPPLMEPPPPPGGRSSDPRPDERGIDTLASWRGRRPRGCEAWRSIRSVLWPWVLAGPMKRLR